MSVSPRKPADPLVTILALAIREIAERRAAETAERRAKMTVVEGRAGGQAA
jgi:hypothetical protein